LHRPDVPAVTLDNQAAIDLALDHLVGLGHQRIVLLGNPSTWEGQQRVAAFEAFFRRRGLAEPPDYLYRIADAGQRASLGTMLAGGAAALDELSCRPMPPTAIISGSSIRATGLLGRAHRQGIAVPDRLSVIAFGDSPLVEHTVPTLTAVDEQVTEQGRQAAELILDRFEGKADGGSIALVPRLILGGSTGPAPSDLRR
jgi:LacI family transcriptional regulator